LLLVLTEQFFEKIRPVSVGADMQKKRTSKRLLFMIPILTDRQPDAIHCSKMFTIAVVVRKRPEVSQKEFRRIWRDVYGPMYRQMPQVKSYVQYHLADRRKDDAEDPIDGIAVMSFESEADMKAAWATEVYKKAATIRESIMRETAVGVHVASVDELVKII